MPAVGLLLGLWHDSQAPLTPGANRVVEGQIPSGQICVDNVAGSQVVPVADLKSTFSTIA